MHNELDGWMDGWMDVCSMNRRQVGGSIERVKKEWVRNMLGFPEFGWIFWSKPCQSYWFLPVATTDELTLKKVPFPTHLLERWMIHFYLCNSYVQCT
jgi:hypothetical protein